MGVLEMNDDFFFEVLRRDGVWIKRYISSKISNVSEAEDVYSDVLSSLFSSFMKDESKRIPPRSFVATIVKRRCIDYYRRRKKDNLIFRALSGTTAEVSDPIVEDYSALTPAQLRVLRLVSLGFSNTDIANRLNISINTVRSHMKCLYRFFGVSSRVLLAFVGKEVVQTLGQRDG